MAVSQLLHSLTLRLSGLGLLAVAGLNFGSISLPGQEGPVAVAQVHPQAVIVAALAGLFLLVPWWLPKGLRRPFAKSHLAWVGPIGALSLLGTLMVIAVLDGVAATAGRPPMPAEAVYAAAIVPFLLFLTTLRLLRSGYNRKRQAPQASFPAGTVGAKRATRRTKLELAHLIFLRLTGVAMFGAVAYGAATQEQLVAFAVGSAVLGLVAAIMHLSPRWTPRLLSRPSRWYHFFTYNILQTVLFTFALLPFAYGFYAPIVELAIADVQAGIQRAPEELAALTEGAMREGPHVIPFLAISAPCMLAWFTMIGLLFQKPLRIGRTAVIPGAPETIKVINPEVPAIGFAMRMYVVADWFVMRLLGLALIGTAYMIWQIIGDQGSAFGPQRLASITQGQDPMHVLYLYGGLGALMAVPFLLPKAIASPRYVVGGLVKSILMVFAAFILIGPMQIAITLYTDEIYHVTLLATAPNVFKAVCGLAVTSTLLISFFKQLGGVQVVDYAGRPVQTFTETEMADIRHARMPVASN